MAFLEQRQGQRLYQLRQQGNYQVTGLFTTLNQVFDRVAIHAVRRSLLKKQARAAGLPLRLISLPWPCSNAQYEGIMEETWLAAVDSRATVIAFGDLFLNDIREYRVKQLKDTELEPIFPLWNLPTSALAEEMIDSGVRAKLTCVDPKQLDGGFAGRDYDLSLLAELPPPGVDPCGENGEFHSFAYQGPMFHHPLEVRVGEIVKRDGFVFADLV